MSARRKALAMVFLALWILPTLFLVMQQLKEEGIISDYLVGNGLQDLPVSRQSAIEISKAVRRDFKNDESQFTYLDLNNRPFFREPAGALITYREGLCDAGTRVIVNLLSNQGYDATRVTLYNQNLESSHTLVSVVLNGREFLVDSIGSPPEVTRLTIEKYITSEMFNVLHYSDDIQRRRAFSAVAIDDDERAFFDRYWLYSYEALPVTKLLTRLGIDVRVFNLGRPPAALSILAEKPYAIKAVLWFLIAGSASVLLLLRLRRR